MLPEWFWSVGKLGNHCWKLFRDLAAAGLPQSLSALGIENSTSQGSSLCCETQVTISELLHFYDFPYFEHVFCGLWCKLRAQGPNLKPWISPPFSPLFHLGIRGDTHFQRELKNCTLWAGAVLQRGTREQNIVHPHLEWPHSPPGTRSHACFRPVRDQCQGVRFPPSGACCKNIRRPPGVLVPGLDFRTCSAS